MTTLRAAIAGCGRVAGNHASALARAAGVELVACCDAVPDRAAAFAARHGIAHPTASLDDLFALGLDAVTVCTPHPVHEEVVVAAAAHGLHVLCEKPIAVDVAAADRMIETTDAAGVTFGVLFQRRFWPAAQRIRRAIDDGRLGRPLIGECHVQLHRSADYYEADPWRGRWDTDGGGVLMTQAVHQVDLLQWFMGEVAEVSGFIATQRHGALIETEDTATASLRFVSGALATINASTVARLNLGNRVAVTGATGAVASVVEFPEGAEGVTDVWTVPGEERYDWTRSAQVEPNVHIDQVNDALRSFHALQIQDFVAAIRDDRPPAVSGREARNSLAIVNAIYESSRTGAVVTLAGREYAR